MLVLYLSILKMYSTSCLAKHIKLLTTTNHQLPWALLFVQRSLLPANKIKTLAYKTSNTILYTVVHLLLVHFVLLEEASVQFLLVS